MFLTVCYKPVCVCPSWRTIQKINEIELENDQTATSEGAGPSWHKEYEDSPYIYIGNLDFGLTEGDILCVFEQYGLCVDINLVKNRTTGKSRGFCFFQYHDPRSAILAVDNFNGIKLCNRTIRVDHVKKENWEHSDKKVEKTQEEKDALFGMPGLRELLQKVETNWREAERTLEKDLKMQEMRRAEQLQREEDFVKAYIAEEEEKRKQKKTEKKKDKTEKKKDKKMSKKGKIKKEMKKVKKELKKKMQEEMAKVKDIRIVEEERRSERSSHVSDQNGGEESRSRDQEKGGESRREGERKERRIEEDREGWRREERGGEKRIREADRRVEMTRDERGKNIGGQHVIEERRRQQVRGEREREEWKREDQRQDGRTGRTDRRTEPNRVGDRDRGMRRQQDRMKDDRAAAERRREEDRPGGRRREEEREERRDERKDARQREETRMERSRQDQRGAERTKEDWRILGSSSSKAKGGWVPPALRLASKWSRPKVEFVERGAPKLRADERDATIVLPPPTSILDNGQYGMPVFDEPASGSDRDPLKI
eukprot:gnl/MRDRNA2_/MRDRNA2_57518_c0_seq1.p1 gnl/MRDRNA2_/MRDRNA2_57518_c0~~gnl/MRDRNA2_/MRDRNA2_57518_c0_seq1.p1  ORF type:complete len:541 (-),score=127.08 gnl/MRDRNA2_/MRDRNA2_57518_c0_seq1:351-1973(-)